MRTLTVLVAALLFAAATCALVHSRHNARGPKAHQLTADYSFEQYQRDFHKSYKSATEYKRREGNFQRALKEVLAHNSQGTRSYKKGINHLSDWDDVELARIRGGRHQPDYKHKYSTPFVGSVKNNADSLDWRTHFPPVVTAVKDQGQCGDCWAHSVTEAIESSYAIATGQLFVLSQQQVTACTPQLGQCYSCGGSFPVLAYEYAVENGITEEWIYPFASYNGSDVACNPNPYISTPINTIVNISGYTLIANNSQPDFISALNSLGPLSILVDASSWSSYESGIFDGCSYADGGIALDHAVQVVGYGTENGKEYWIVRNSWAPSWGEDGYIRLLKTATPKCGWNTGAAYPTDCTGNGPAQTWSCGECGILFGPTFPVAAPAPSSSSSASSQSSSSGSASSSSGSASSSSGSASSSSGSASSSSGSASSSSGSAPSSSSGSAPSSSSGSSPSSSSGSSPSSSSGSSPSSSSGSAPTAPFVVYGIGQQFPNPPNGYTQASLADIKSAAFVQLYNSNQLTDMNQEMAGCCVFSLTDGYLQYNGQFVVPYAAGGTRQCLEQLSNPVYFGTDEGQWVQKLEPKTLSASTQIQAFCAGTQPNYFAIYKQQ